MTLHLASRHLAFKGKTSTLDDVHNGNFLGTLELLSHYIPLLHEHLDKIMKKEKEKVLSRLLRSQRFWLC